MPANPLRLIAERISKWRSSGAPATNLAPNDADQPSPASRDDGNVHRRRAEAENELRKYIIPPPSAKQITFTNAAKNQYAHTDFTNVLQADGQPGIAPTNAAKNQYAHTDFTNVSQVDGQPGIAPTNASKNQYAHTDFTNVSQADGQPGIAPTNAAKNQYAHTDFTNVSQADGQPGIAPTNAAKNEYVDYDDVMALPQPNGRSGVAPTNASKNEYLEYGDVMGLAQPSTMGSRAKNVNPAAPSGQSVGDWNDLKNFVIPPTTNKPYNPPGRRAEAENELRTYIIPPPSAKQSTFTNASTNQYAHTDFTNVSQADGQPGIAPTNAAKNEYVDYGDVMALPQPNGRSGVAPTNAAKNEYVEYGDVMSLAQPNAMGSRAKNVNPPAPQPRDLVLQHSELNAANTRTNVGQKPTTSVPKMEVGKRK
jgi:hypothetical protein